MDQQAIDKYRGLLREKLNEQVDMISAAINTECPNSEFEYYIGVFIDISSDQTITIGFDINYQYDRDFKLILNYHIAEFKHRFDLTTIEYDDVDNLVNATVSRIIIHIMRAMVLGVSGLNFRGWILGDNKIREADFLLREKLDNHYPPNELECSYVHSDGYSEAVYPVLAYNLSFNELITLYKYKYNRSKEREISK